MMLAPTEEGKRKREVKACKKGRRTRTNAASEFSADVPAINRQTIMPFPALESSIGQISDSSFDAAELLSQLEKT